MSIICLIKLEEWFLRQKIRRKNGFGLYRFQKRKDLFPVGRLDKDTEGLLLITNDGELAHRLLSPKKHVDKTYFVKLREPLKQEYEAALENGIDIGEEALTLPAKLEICSEDRKTVCLQFMKESFIR